MRVLVIDPSLPWRTVVSKVLERLPQVTSVHGAPNGRIALQAMSHYKPDLVLLDLDMPEMNGFEFLDHMKQDESVKTVVLTSSVLNTERNATRALGLGALDFLVKPEAQLVGASYNQVKAVLEPFFLALAHPSSAHRLRHGSRPMIRSPEALVVASSTGGPAALETLLGHHSLQKPRFPIFIAQHMPPNFTVSLAQRLNDCSGLVCREARDGELVDAGMVYVAPGNFHMRLHKSSLGIQIRLAQDPRIHEVRPAADYLFETAADIYRDKLCAFVLSGMGRDSCHGAVRIKDLGGQVVIQDYETSAVWGMPGSVHASGAYDLMQSIDDCHHTLLQLCKDGAL